MIWYDLASLRSDDEDDQPDLEFAFTGGESRAVANPSILWEIPIGVFSRHEVSLFFPCWKREGKKVRFELPLQTLELGIWQTSAAVLVDVASPGASIRY